MANQLFQQLIPLPFPLVTKVLLLFLILCKLASAITEIEALLKWKESLPKQSILDTWVINNPSNLSSKLAPNYSPCEWQGITCSNYSSNITTVIEINLAYTGLNGTLQNLDFSSFPNLLRLDLKVNNLNGSIPPSIGLLNKLQFLDLSTNSLNSTLPPSLANLTEVYELDVSRNYITGALHPSFFPREDSKIGLKSIKNFLMQDTQVGGELPEEIGNMKYLEIIAFDACKFYGAIPEAIGKLRNLRILRLNENNFSGLIPEGVGKLTNLSDLRLFSNKLSGQLPQELGISSALVIVHVFDNNFTGHLPPGLCHGNKLVNFTAAANSFTGPIPRSLKNCSTLYRLRLEENKLKGNLDEAFGVYPSLNYIDLSDNQLTGNLSPNWGNCKNLTKLNIATNMVSGQIPNEITRLNNLVVLDLSFNNFSGTIPENIGDLSSLSSLQLQGNHQLSGSVPSGIGKLSNLVSLDLSMNKFDGSIPREIGDCSRLQNLSLSGNRLNGSIPFEIGNLFSLQDSLDLSYNSLVGEIPSSLGKLMYLESLNLSHNHLFGSIPHSLSQMMGLVKINLAFNNLSGSLPSGGVFDNAVQEDFVNNTYLCGNVVGMRQCAYVFVGRQTKNERKQKLMIIVVPTLLSALVFSMLLLGIILCLFRREKTRQRSSNDYNKTKRQSRPMPLTNILGYNGKLVYEDIIEATENFDDKYCIGEGGSGKVYKVEMASGEVLAVKRLKNFSDSEKMDETIEKMKSFKSEVAALTEIRHRNIVKLYGFCWRGEHTFLVYDFIERGSLGDVLKNVGIAMELDWVKRIEIVKGVAEALCYLHHDCVPAIVHRDVTANNVLLDSDFEPHVADFGTARFLKFDALHSTGVAGTHGYVAPELAYTNKATEKCDVFSFGVVVLEVIMGRHPGETILCLELEMMMKELLDARLQHPHEGGKLYSELASLVSIAISCVKVEPHSRPSMRTVCHLMGVQ